MAYHPAKHHRRSIRLRGYDYRQAGAYFVTIVTKDRTCLFGEVVGPGICLNALGEAVRACWRDLARHVPHIALDEFIVMPNHLHGILIVEERLGEAFEIGKRENVVSVSSNASPLPGPHSNGTLPGSLGAVMQTFKSVSTRRVNQLSTATGARVWQRNYYERIIRDEAELQEKRQYIADNPLQWALDNENLHGQLPAM